MDLPPCGGFVCCNTNLFVFSGVQEVHSHSCPHTLSYRLALWQFGGKLVSLDNAKPQQQQPSSHLVHISQVVTETALLDRSEQLQATLSSRNFVGFCQEKIDAAENEFEKTLWSFLKVRAERERFQESFF